MFRPHFNIDFFGGEGKWGSILSDRGLEGSILKLDIQRAFFLTFLSKIEGWRSDESTRFTPMWPGFEYLRYAIPRLVLCSPQREYFPIPIRWAISSQNPYVVDALPQNLCLFVYFILISFLLLLSSLHPFDLRSTIHLFARKLFHAAMDGGRFPFTKNSGLKFWKFHVPLSGTVHTGCTDVTETTECLIRAKHNTRAKIKQKSPEKWLTR